MQWYQCLNNVQSEKGTDIKDIKTNLHCHWFPVFYCIGDIECDVPGKNKKKRTERKNHMFAMGKESVTHF